MAHRMFALLGAHLLLRGADLAAAGAADMASSQPKIFAPGSLSGLAAVECLTFAPDGAAVFFDRAA
ncbi:hypothetical protein [Rhodanobacter hydrolyticus]|uniref:Uncharacterized protein n=1 Tax=Rhodanobacter hydrolyticus TaxID=2250595 RepID=A0ABW8J7E5_9GAMM